MHNLRVSVKRNFACRAKLRRKRERMFLRALNFFERALHVVPVLAEVIALAFADEPSVGGVHKSLVVKHKLRAHNHVAAHILRERVVPVMDSAHRNAVPPALAHRAGTERRLKLFLAYAPELVRLELLERLAPRHSLYALALRNERVVYVGNHRVAKLHEVFPLRHVRPLCLAVQGAEHKLRFFRAAPRIRTDIRADVFRKVFADYAEVTLLPSFRHAVVCARKVHVAAQRGKNSGKAYFSFLAFKLRRSLWKVIDFRHLPAVQELRAVVFAVVEQQLWRHAVVPAHHVVRHDN